MSQENQRADFKEESPSVCEGAASTPFLRMHAQQRFQKLVISAECLELYNSSWLCEALERDWVCREQSWAVEGGSQRRTLATWEEVCPGVRALSIRRLERSQRMKDKNRDAPEKKTAGTAGS